MIFNKRFLTIAIWFFISGILLAQNPVVMYTDGKKLYAGFANDASPTVQIDTNDAIEYGIVKNWFKLKTLVTAAYQQLGTDPTKQPIIFSDVPLNPKKDREKLCNLFVSVLKVPGFYVSDYQTLSLHNYEKKTGVVCSTVEDISHSTPIKDGLVLPHGITRFGLGCKNLSDYLIEVITKRGGSLDENTKKQIFDELDKIIYIALDYRQEMRSPTKGSYKLANGEIVTAKERLYIGEILMRPAVVGDRSSYGLQEMVYYSIMECDVDIRSSLFANIFITGSYIEGIVERMKKEISNALPPKTNVTITYSKNKWTSWMGGAKLGKKLSDENYVTLADYQKLGAASVHKKCP